jgi:eukaryotic-like serine/threonine-protein kinase
LVAPGKSTSSLRLTSIRKIKSVFGGASGLSTRGFARRHLWIWPVLAILVLAAVTAFVRTRIERGIQQQMESQLLALRNADVAALELWLHAQEGNAESEATDPEVRSAILELVAYAASGKTSTAELLQCPARAKLSQAITTSLQAQHYTGYTVVDKEGIILTSKSESLIGQKQQASYAGFIESVFDGKPLVSKPFKSRAMIEDEWGELAVGVPTMYAAAPVLDDEGKPAAVLCLRIRPDQEFTRILNVARFGESGETYAFDKDGILLSQSRFEDELKQLGLQPDQAKSRSVLSVEMRDPGVDLTTGARSPLRRAEQPLTRSAAGAIEGTSGVDVDGYRDYRGVETIGAWTWLPEYGFGVVTEIDKREAFGPIYALRSGFWTLFGLLAAAGVGLFVLTLVAGRLDKKMREAVVAAGQLGQYALEDKIGEGGMGAVYRARHALLRRPTAVKLLEPAKSTELAIARFEREVQMTSQLNHPNTITIYDYGRTQEGVFYYAMEYLDGFSLQSLIDRFGPVSDGRAIHILLQVCGSLAEAHSMGLMHRDIKPANIMLTRRAGVGDFAKLLDFGLVKAQGTRAQTMLTATDTITGTPLYMSPESIQDPERTDSRSDLYALGAVGYFLLTGQPPFEANNVLEIIRHHIESTPTPVSQVARQPISKELDAAIMACLAKSPSDRPPSAADLAEMLRNATPITAWTSNDADRWWQQFDPARSNDLEATRDVNLASTMGYSDIQTKK